MILCGGHQNWNDDVDGDLDSAVEGNADDDNDELADACTLFSHLQRQDMLPPCSLQAIVVACCCIVNGIVPLFLDRFVSSANQSECHCHPKYCHGDKYSGLVRDCEPSLGTSMESASKTTHAFREKQQAFRGILQRQQTEHRAKSNEQQGQALRINASTNKEQ